MLQATNTAAGWLRPPIRSGRQIVVTMYVDHLRIPVGAGGLHAERVGLGGHPVVLLHGFGTCAFLWRRMAPLLASAGYTAIAIDLLGYGESDRPEDATYSLAAQAEHVGRAIAALRLPSVFLVGQDIGALIALLLAASPRTHVDGVVLLSPPDPDDLPPADVRALQRGAALMALSSNSLFGAHPALTTLLRGAVAKPEHMPDLLIARYLAPFVGADGLAQLLQRAAAIDWSPDVRSRLNEVTAPVLVLDGDAESPRPSLSWSAIMPDANVVSERIAGAARLIPEDAPDALFARVTEWLERQRKG